MFKKIVVSGFVALLAGCGGGGGGGSSSPAPAEPATNELSGRVIDGYINGANVCLDINDNHVCDDGEPAGLSSVGGTYVIEYTDTIAAGTQVLAEIPVGALDEDLGRVEKAYSMQAPAESATVVTPLTTLVSQEVLSSGKKTSAVEAEASVKATLGFAADKNLLGNDFIEDEDTMLQTVATVVATALATTKDELTSNTAVAAELDEQQITQAAVKSVKVNAERLIVNGEAALTDAEAQSVATSIVGDQAASIVTNAKAGDGEVRDLLDSMNSGELLLISDTFYGALDIAPTNGVRDEAEVDGRVEGLGVEFFYYPDAIADQFFDVRAPTVAVLSDNDGNEPLDWYRGFDNDDDLVLFDDRWLTSDESESAKVSGNCVSFFGPDEVAVQEFCFLSKDVAGETINDIIPQVCEEEDGDTVVGCDPMTTLPEGSYVYDLTIKTSDNEYGGVYTLYSGGDWGGYLPNGEAQTISNFIDYHANGNKAYIGDNCNTQFEIASYDENGGKGMAEWTDMAGIGCSDPRPTEGSRDTEQTAFSVETFGDVKLVKVATPKIYVKNNGSKGRSHHIFALGADSDGNDGIYNGDFVPSKVTTSRPFTGNTQEGVFASKIFLNTVLEQLGMPVFPYDELLVEE